MSAGIDGPRPRLGQIATLGLLVVAALASAALQRGDWWTAMPSTARLAMATALLAAYGALCTASMRGRRAASAPPMPGNDERIVVAWASQTGFAHELAQHTAATLRAAGVPAQALPLDTLDAATLPRLRRLLLIASTTGEGDPPDHALRFVREAMRDDAGLAGLEYGVLALGDANYARFCEFGRQLDRWLHRRGAHAMFDRVDVDAGDPGALRHWQHHLGLLAGRTDLPDWSPPHYGRWRLERREHLNPGSPGGAAFHLELSPPEGVAPGWTAGDIAEIGPRHAPARVDAWLAAHRLDGDAPVDRADAPRLRDALARARLPEAIGTRDPHAIVDALAPLPHREYSIASIARDGRVHLLVRQVRRPDGGIGLGSGWLTDAARVGDAIDLRIRRNPGFHPPDAATPLVLIGNGTGLAGLRAHWRLRGRQGRTWLLFGERTLERDFFHRDEIEAALRNGVLERVDLAFSRDGDGPRYVQDALRLQADRLRRWVEDGAAIYVCGSLDGMAPGVDAVLRETLGDAHVDALLADGRYRRDVY
ncbi:MAG TPA: sulfite reductase flavoprotein subunit alpha [Lysobacter sp.]